VFCSVHYSSCLTKPQEQLILGVHPPPDGKPEEESIKLLVELLCQGGAKPEPGSDIVAQRWRKVLWCVLGWLLRFCHFPTPHKTQERGVFNFVHDFAG